MFTLTYSNKAQTSSTVVEDVVVTMSAPQVNAFAPHQRRSSFLQFYKGNLYLYGGKYEDKNDKEFTFNDLYCLNVKKLDEWKTLYEDKEMYSELKKQADNSDMDDDSWEDDDDDDDEDDDDDDSDMEINAPKVEPDETLEDYFKRTDELWLTEAHNEFPNEKSKKILNKMASELCNMFYESSKATASK